MSSAQDEKAQLQETLRQKLAINAESKVIEKGVNERRALNNGFSPNATVYFKRNQDSQYHLDSSSTKVLIEGCENCFIKINGHVRTETIELWRSNGCTLYLNTPVKTIQIDLCDNLKVVFAKKQYFDQLIWAGCHEIHILIGDEETGDRIDSGVDEVKSEVNDLKDNFDQFIVRYISGKLTQELVVRLDNGFPTTNREADAFDEQKAKNDKAYEEHIRKMLSAPQFEAQLSNLTHADPAPEANADPAPEPKSE